MVTPNEASEKPQDQVNKVQQVFEKPYQQYLKTLQGIQKDWHEETHKQLADHTRSQLETALAQSTRTWNQATCLPSPCTRTAHQITLSAWETIKGSGRSADAYTAFLAQLKRAFAEVRPEDVSAVVLDGIANCMKVVASYAHQGRADQAGKS
jgi:hypothetical protein